MNTRQLQLCSKMRFIPINCPMNGNLCKDISHSYELFFGVLFLLTTQLTSTIWLFFNRNLDDILREDFLDEFWPF